MQYSVVILLGSALLAGCAGGQTGGETGLDASGGRGKPDAGETGGGAGAAPEGTGGKAEPDGTGGQAEPGANYDECTEAADCVTMVEERLAPLSGPTTNHPTFTGAECTKAGVSTDTESVSGYACDCSQGEGSLMVGPIGLGCYLYGRGGDCLFDDSQFSGCTLAESDKCQDVCNELGAKLAADAARTFETDVVYTTCEDAVCHSVVEVDGRCFADWSYETGQAFDCSLGGKAILEKYREALSESAHDALPTESSVENGTSGFVDISVSSSPSTGQPPGFGGWAQFFGEPQGESTMSGSVLDPLEGIDDCTVVDRGDSGSGFPTTWVDIGEFVLVDGSHEYAMDQTSASHDGYYAYGVELTELGVEPRFGGEYGLRGSGGGFGESFEIDGLRLPEALSVTELESNSPFERGALRLTWSGEGDAPLRIQLSINPLPLDVGDPYEIECLAADDGEFTIPAEVLEAAPEGFGWASFRRQNRVIADAGEKTMTVNGIVYVDYPFVLAEQCERPEVAAACERYVEQYLSALTECGGTDLPATESLCPEYETQACQVCAEYYDCAAANTVCREDGLYTYDAGCTCP